MVVFVWAYIAFENMPFGALISALGTSLLGVFETGYSWIENVRKHSLGRASNARGAFLDSASLNHNLGRHLDAFLQKGLSTAICYVLFYGVDCANRQACSRVWC